MQSKHFNRTFYQLALMFLLSGLYKMQKMHVGFDLTKSDILIGLIIKICG
jgi:hypothetical protein